MKKRQYKYTLHIPQDLRQKILNEQKKLEGKPPYQPVTIKSIIINRLYESYKTGDTK